MSFGALLVTIGPDAIVVAVVVAVVNVDVDVEALLCMAAVAALLE